METDPYPYDLLFSLAESIYESLGIFDCVLFCCESPHTLRRDLAIRVKEFIDEIDEYKGTSHGMILRMFRRITRIIPLYLCMLHDFLTPFLHRLEENCRAMWILSDILAYEYLILPCFSSFIDGSKQAFILIIVDPAMRSILCPSCTIPIISYACTAIPQSRIIISEWLLLLFPEFSFLQFRFIDVNQDYTLDCCNHLKTDGSDCFR